MNKVDTNIRSSISPNGAVRTITSLELEQLQDQLKELTTMPANPTPTSRSPDASSSSRASSVSHGGSSSRSSRSQRLLRGGSHKSSITKKLRNSIVSGRFNNGSQERGLILVEDHQMRLDTEIKFLEEDLKKLEQQQELDKSCCSSGTATNGTKQGGGGRFSHLPSKFSKLSASIRRSVTK